MTARLLLAALLICLCGSAWADDALWRALREGGYTLVVRHSISPGSGDPANFKLEDCTTQRNLSDDGRAQARHIGETVRAKGVPVGDVLSSRWCRALETARLAFGKVKGEPTLDQFYQPEERDQRTAAVRAIMSGAPTKGTNLVMVTHQPNITALANLSVTEGEIVVMGLANDGTLAVYGRLKP
jgi:phosphohistidine phosphatase SixA